MTIANYITAVRIMLIPVIVHTMMCDAWLYAFILFAVAALTDFLDGFVARRYNCKSLLGKILDPVADKLLVLACFYAFTHDHVLISIPVSFFIFLLIKEALLICGGSILFALRREIVPPSFVAKITTTAEMIVILWLSLCRAGLLFCSPFLLQSLLGAVVMASLYILIDYTHKGIACLRT